MIKRIGPIIVALVLFNLSIIYAGPLTYYLTETFWLKPGVTESIGTFQAEEAFKGTILQQKAFESTDILPLYGSSELSSMSQFHPSQLFGSKPSGFIPFVVGRGGYQDIIHSICLGAQGAQLKNRKVAIILSAQWFTTEGISDHYFAMNFSALQSYKLMNNPFLSETSKQQIAKRILDFPNAIEPYPGLKQILLKHVNPDQRRTIYQQMYALTSLFEIASLEIKDAVKTILYTYKLNPVDVKSLAGSGKVTVLPPWDQIRNKAVSEAKPLITNNNLGILDSYFNQYVKSTLNTARNSAVGDTLYPSREYADLDLLLQVLQEEGAKPLFIIMPVNGYWYDYIGFPKSERTAYYDRIEKSISDYGFPVANFGQHEYEMYFLKDTMHVGWKGWVYVDEALYQFYQE